VLLRVHTQVVLGKASGAVRLVEGAVTTVKDVDFGIGKLWVAEGIDLAVLVAYKLGPIGN
jgi:hypothetical protein